jgi:hypothetical protein
MTNEDDIVRQKFFEIWRSDLGWVQQEGRKEKDVCEWQII